MGFEWEPLDERSDAGLTEARTAVSGDARDEATAEPRRQGTTRQPGRHRRQTVAVRDWRRYFQRK
jgi:hypothetical protein